MAEENSDTFNCHCGKQFKRSSAYRRHQEVAHSTCASHKCTECGKTFGNANTLTMHMSVHEKKEAFTILVRPATRATRSTLRVLQEEAGGNGGAAAASQHSHGASSNSTNSQQQTKEPPPGAQQTTASSRSKRQSTREAKQDTSIGGSVLPQLDCVRQTRAGAKVEAGSGSSSSPSATTCSSSAAPTTVVEAPPVRSTTPTAAALQLQQQTTSKLVVVGTRTRTAAAAEAAAAVAAAAASPGHHHKPSGQVGTLVLPPEATNPAAAGQVGQQQQQREGASSSRSAHDDEVCHDATAGSVRLEQPRSGSSSGGSSSSPLVAPDHPGSSSSSSSRTTGAQEVELHSKQGTGGGVVGARPGVAGVAASTTTTTTRLPAGREESKLEQHGLTPDGQLTEDDANTPGSDFSTQRVVKTLSSQHKVLSPATVGGHAQHHTPQPGDSGIDGSCITTGVGATNTGLPHHHPTVVHHRGVAAAKSTSLLSQHSEPSTTPATATTLGGAATNNSDRSSSLIPVQHHQQHLSLSPSLTATTTTTTVGAPHLNTNITTLPGVAAVVDEATVIGSQQAAAIVELFNGCLLQQAVPPHQQPSVSSCSTTTTQDQHHALVTTTTTNIDSTTTTTTGEHPLQTPTTIEEADWEGEDEDDGHTKQAVRKSSRDRKENPIWKTLLTGRMYEEVLNGVESGRGNSTGGTPSKRQRRATDVIHDVTSTPLLSTTTPPGGSHLQPTCGYNLTMIPTTVVKQEPMDYVFNPDNIKQELIDMDDCVDPGQGLPDMVSGLQYQRLKRGPVRRTRSGSMGPGNGQVQRNSPTATFDCLVCGKTFISEKYLSMHISLHETAKTEPGTVPLELEDMMCPGQINPVPVVQQKVHLLEGEVIKPQESAVDLPNLPAIVEEISTVTANNTPTSNNHFKPTPPTNNKKSNNSNNGNKKATKLQTDGGWSCSLCNKTFAHNSGYKNHMRTHSNERPYVCHICDIGFKEKYHLKKHNLFIHSNELPEKCRVCGKRFKDSTAVRAHERIHSDERPFACRQCAKTFKTSECLWHHEHRSKTCGLALGEIIAQERLIRRRRRFPKSGNGNGGQQQSPNSPASESDTNPESLSPTNHHMEQGEVNGADLNNVQYKWGPSQPHHHMGAPPPVQQHHQQHHHQVAPLQHHHEQLTPTHNGHHAQHPHSQHHHKMSNNVDQYIPPVTTFFPTTTSNSLPLQVAASSAVNKHSMIASQLQSCLAPLHHPEVTSALQATPLPTPPNQVPLCVEQHNMSSMSHSPPPSEEDRLSPTNLAMTMTMKDLNCLAEIPHGMHPHEDDMVVAHSMYNPADIKQERDVFGYTMDEDEENWVTTNMDTIMDKEDDLIDSKVDAILSNMASSMSSAFGMLAGDPLPDPVAMVDFTDGKEYRCRVCRKAFSDLVAFQRHSKVHSDERPFLCLKCDIGFKMKVHLKKHNLYVHSNEYPCECQHCGKKFKDSSAVKLHERTHSDTRPFGCTGCGKAFKTRENLWGHQHRGKCIAQRKKADQEGGFDEPTSAKASVLNNGMTAHATVNTNGGVTAQACVNNSHVTAHASIGENNQITAHATFANSQFTAHASVVNNQVTAHASINTGVPTTLNDVKMQNDGSFNYTNNTTPGGVPRSTVETSMTDSKTMSGSIPSTTSAQQVLQYGGNPPAMTKSFIAQSLMTPPLNKMAGGVTEGTTIRTGQTQPQNASPTAGSLPATSPAPDTATGTGALTTTAQAHKDKTSGSSSLAAAKWPTLKEFLSKGIGPPTPVPTWSGVPPAVSKGNTAQAPANNNNNNNTNNNNNNNGEYKQLANDYPALKERLSRNFFSQLPTVVTVAPPLPASSTSSSANNTSYPSSPVSSNLSAPYSSSGQTTPTAGTSPYGKGRDSVSPYSDYSPSHSGSSSGVIPSFQSTFLTKRTNPVPPLYGNNPMLRGEDPNIPIIYWDDEGDQRPPSSVWTSPESDSMFQDISESVFTQL